MYQKFDENIEKVLATVSNKMYRATNRRYLLAFKEYLSQNQLPYSHQAAMEWLAKNESNWVHSKFTVCRTALFKLNDVMTGGFVTSGWKYPYSDAPAYVKLSAWSKELLDSFLRTTPQYAHGDKKPPRAAIAKFLLFLEEGGVESKEEISIKYFIDYLRHMNEVYPIYTDRRIQIRYIGVFLSEMSEPAIFDLLAKRQGTSSFLFLDEMPDNQKILFTDAIKAGNSNSMPVDEFFLTIQKKK